MTGLRAQTRGEIKGLLRKHQIRPRKHLGQHFLADPNIVERIVRLAGVGPGDRVVEIGVGTATLTRGLRAAGAEVVGIEVDESLRGLIGEAVAGLSGVTIHFGDAMDMDLAPLLGPGPWRMVANLPYNVATPLVIETLRNVPAIEYMVVMVQKEVADRMVAGPGSPSYGLPSVSVALRAEAKREFVVPPQVFLPVPEVDSAVVSIRRREPSALADPAQALAAAAFNQRRKMLRRSLATVLTEPGAVLEAAGVDPAARAEDLSAGEYLALAAAVP